MWAGPAGLPANAQQEPAEQKKPDTFFAGTINEVTAQKITVSRMVLGKTENRSFRITPETKIEGKLRVKVRVTVRYISGEDGEVATQIVVRPAEPKKK